MRGTSPRRSQDDFRMITAGSSSLEGSMLGRKEVQKPAPPLAQVYLIEDKRAGQTAPR